MNKEKPSFLFFALPDIRNEEISEVVDTLKSGWLTTGPKTKQFEKDFGYFINQPHALAVNSATAGLHLALEAIGVSRGDQVITTPYTFTASAEVIRYLDADPIFVDIDARTFNIEPEKIVAAITPKTKAILPVHFGGQACDMKPIMEIAKAYNLHIIEDAAHALPTTYRGNMVGTIGDATVFSFYATKTLTTGEGGMVVTASDQMAKRIKTMRLHGIDRDAFGRYTSESPAWYYEIAAPGYKYNMTDIAASIGIHQLKKANQFQKRRETIAHRYTEAFADMPMQTPFVKQVADTHAWHLYVIQLKLEELGINRDQFIGLMNAEGIGTSVHFIPLHIQPYWRDRYHLQPDDFPVAYDVYLRSVSLPIYPKMTDDDIERVITAVRKVVIENSK